MAQSTDLATFAAGCFWGIEDALRQVPGVIEATSGYSGGTLANPTYEQVCTGGTGHAEVVQVSFDPAVVAYERLLDAFWKLHDPTTLDRQGPDVGRQYRSAIFYHSPKQGAAAIRSRDEAQTRFTRTIVTEISPATTFYRAEEYHQRYLQKNGPSSCRLP